MDIEELNAQNKALTTLLDNTIESISKTDKHLKDYEFNRLEDSIYYIIGQLSKNTEKISDFLEVKKFD